MALLPVTRFRGLADQTLRCVARRCVTGATWAPRRKSAPCLSAATDWDDGDEAAGVTSSLHALSQCNDVSRRQLHACRAAFALTCVARSNLFSIGAPALAL